MKAFVFYNRSTGAVKGTAICDDALLAVNKEAMVTYKKDVACFDVEIDHPVMQDITGWRFYENMLVRDDHGTDRG